MTEQQAIALAILLPLLAALVVLCWASLLRRRGGFEGRPGRLHGLGVYFDSARARELALDVASLGSSTLVTLLTTMFALLWLVADDVRAAVLLVLASSLAAIFGSALKKLTRRLRPGAAAATFFGSSFPSSHTLMGSTLYGTATWLLVGSGRWPAGEAFILAMAAMLALLIGFSRVVLRVHYLSDVVAGWFMAASLVVSAALLQGL
ncbi:MAG: phosphatase PAP2 family protein [Pseudomonadota bacterium]